MRTTAYLKAVIEVHGKKTITGLGIRPVLLDTLADMFVTCNTSYVLMHCFDFNKSYNDFRVQKVHLLKTKIIKTAEKEPYSLYG